MRTIAIIIALAVGASGCAIAAARGPGKVSLSERPSCNGGKGAVVADGIAAAVLGLAAISLASGDEGGYGAVAGLSSLVFIGSAVSGSKSADRCREAREEYDRLVEARVEGTDTRTGAWVDPTPPPIGPRPVAVAPVAAPPAPTPTMTMRPPAAAGADDDEGEDEEEDEEEDEGDDGDIDTGRWAEFWREVKP